MTNDPVKDKLSIYFEPLATAYKEICEKQEKKQKPFFGLRDFYRYYECIKYKTYIHLTVTVSLKCCIGCAKRATCH